MPTVSVIEIDVTGQEIPGTEKKFQIDKGSILFDALADQGLKLPHGCLAGSCGSCRILIIEGRENVATPGVIEENTIESLIEDYTSRKGADFVSQKVIRLSCRTKVLGDIKVAALKG